MDNVDPTPAIPHRTRHHHNTTSLYSRRRSLQGPAGVAGSSSHRSSDVQPASPEVISSLISSLSVISKPADRHFEGPSLTSLSLPNSPRNASFGSFGVDYGAYSQPSLDDLREESVPLDELAASPPVIRTAKPPSGFSPLTAPKSPSRESSGGLKSILRTGSRPSSKGSLGSRDDAQSIGNLSIERGVAPASESTRSRSRSRDSWGKKQSRSNKGLMYMSSKERLREREYEKRRASSQSDDFVAPRPDPFLAETSISEEPAAASEPSTRANAPPTDDSAMDATSGPRPIPARDSSLRKSTNSAKRSSARGARVKRESETVNEKIPEVEERGHAKSSQRQSKHESWRRISDSGSRSRSADLVRGEVDDAQLSSHAAATTTTTTTTTTTARVPQSREELEDSAPFPAVAQGRRRDEHGADKSKRKSGRQTPDPSDVVRPKRSSSRLKRLSAPLSPRPDGGSANAPNEAATEPERASTIPAGYERPQSADSIDDAVESYLCSPRLSQKIKHPQTGRVISFSEVGDSEGSAVFCCVGMGLTRYITAFYDELAFTLKLRLITPDRPGVGDSEPYADGTATPLSWPDDVYAICQALKITKFSILAHSAGAIYALATALRMPQHIRGRIHLLAPWIPPSQMNVFGGSQTLPPSNAIPTSQRILRALPTPFLKAANSSFMTATSSSITSSLPKTPRRGKRKSTPATGRDTPAPARRDVTPSLDKENIGQMGTHAKSREADVGRSPAPDAMDRLRSHPSHSALQGSGSGSGPQGTPTDPEATILAAAANAMADKERQVTYDTRLTHAIWDLATTGANPAVDLLVCLERRHTIGFRYVDITRPVVIQHGSRDTRVPVDNVRWLGKTMRRCEVRVLEGEGHGLMASATVMGSVLMEISKEWEDWMRVTGHGGKREERGRRATLVRCEVRGER
ncbi:alpha/beta-hydrolase [Sodiomyces alkalinus F11]|uniref:Alpha/beta-hydrolase n=1 Tax=Sodiomyces alkalinus (strain CBS 110278 / VKM F-3762 / F11) TaxID=1314773 RepID=A0A3N2PQ97_SODAK|nr:alpha/beta-hydrolase [Sodiomyces alkalinus F11]ROT36682.1 alpha/beta-hydrolase [Sodiomyces alkalinus F11]